MGNIVSKVLGGGANKAAVAEAERARQVQEKVAADEKAYREAQKNIQQNMQSLQDPSAGQTSTVISGGGADLAAGELSLKKKRSSGGIASTLGLNV